MTRPLLRLGLVALLLAPVAGGCVSQKHLQDAENEIIKLREERTRLRRDNDALNRQVQSYEAQLVAANAKLMEQPKLPDYADVKATGIDVFRRGNTIVFSVPAEISFASGKADLSSNGRNALRTVADKLKRDFPDGVYWIEGHTDNDPIRKSGFGSNRELSLARSMSVLRYLVDEAGISDERCVIAGFGEYWPNVPNDSSANKAKNRRVEIAVHRPKAN
jgi:chemotaxis protein MotB